MQIVLKEESYAVMGACFEVYGDKGAGFVEPIYHECLQIAYMGRVLKHGPGPDFVCFGKLILEIKAVRALCDENRAQLLSYLKATGFELGLLVNFCGQGELEWERLLRTDDPKKYAPDPESPRHQS